MFQNEASTAPPSSSIAIGGAKGHAVETIDGDLLRLYVGCRWKPIPRCTGRYTCRDHGLSRLHPLALVRKFALSGEGTIEGSDIDVDPSEVRVPRIWEFTPPGRDDAILVVPLDSSNRTGIISYKKEPPAGDGSGRSSGGPTGPPPRGEASSYVHTLNAPSGFRRKLEAMGLTVTDDDVVFEPGKEA